MADANRSRTTEIKDIYTAEEVATMLHLGESAVKLRLMRGRRKLKELLSEEVFGK